MNGNASPAKFEPPPTQPTTTSGNAARELHLGDRLLPDHGLVEQHVVEHAAERVGGVVAAGGVLDRLGDRDAEAARASPASASSTARPDCVSGDGLATTSAPHVSISDRRNGFWSYETRTM